VRWLAICGGVEDECGGGDDDDDDCDGGDLMISVATVVTMSVL